MTHVRFLGRHDVQTAGQTPQGFGKIFVLPNFTRRSLSIQTAWGGKSPLLVKNFAKDIHPISVGISEMCLMTSGKPRMLNWNLQKNKNEHLSTLFDEDEKKHSKTNEGQQRSSGKPMWELQLRASCTPTKTDPNTTTVFGFSPAKASPDFWQLELCFFESTSYPAAFHLLQNAVKPGADFSETTVKPTSWWWKHRVFKVDNFVIKTRKCFVSFRFNQTIVFISNKNRRPQLKKTSPFVSKLSRFEPTNHRHPNQPRKSACVLIGRVLTSMADNTSGIFASKSRLRSKATGSCVSSQPGGLAVVGWNLT